MIICSPPRSCSAGGLASHLCAGTGWMFERSVTNPRSDRGWGVQRVRDHVVRPQLLLISPAACVHAGPRCGPVAESSRTRPRPRRPRRLPAPPQSFRVRPHVLLPQRPHARGVPERGEPETARTSRGGGSRHTGRTWSGSGALVIPPAWQDVWI